MISILKSFCRLFLIFEGMCIKIVIKMDNHPLNAFIESVYHYFQVLSEYNTLESKTQRGKIKYCLKPSM